MGSVIYEVMQHQMDTTRVRFAQNKKTGEYEKVVLNRPITESTLQSYRTIACNYLKYCKANHRVRISFQPFVNAYSTRLSPGVVFHPYCPHGTHVSPWVSATSLNRLL